jgi:hypothetical protein
MRRTRMSDSGGGSLRNLDDARDPGGGIGFDPELHPLGADRILLAVGSVDETRGGEASWR